MISISHDHHITEVNQLHPIEEDISQAESSNQNNQEEQEDEGNVDDNFAEEEEDGTEGRNVLVKFLTRRGKQTYKYVCQITQTDSLLKASSPQITIER
ncbi:hypothetical protein JTB14_019037 [Gonioctena quinquepunctata]|nr:hypothetical protein JTB14_019037 [Gonioctena quinquepunctata]